MKFSENWLREWVNPNIDSATLGNQLTMAGLEVDSFHSVPIHFDNVIVVEIVDIEPHSNADKLRVCQVHAGDSDYQIVCGAPNVYVGMHVPLAMVGARLGTGENRLKIKKSKIRGIESQGMLCSASELGFEDQVDGLWDIGSGTVVGQSLVDALGLNDVGFELSVTPNRGDCLSIAGIAREISVINKIEAKLPFKVIDSIPTISTHLKVTIHEPEACPFYYGRVFKNIDKNAKTPIWMVNKLAKSGIRCHSLIVDISNYVLIETGQPLHAFDLDKLDGDIQVRMPAKNETLTLLDGKEVSLEKNTLVIADESRAIAMAGIMGGLNTVIDEHTEHLFLECAYFAPSAIAGQARTYGLATDAAYRYERGIDPKGVIPALQRATQLIMELLTTETSEIVMSEATPVEQVNKVPAIPFEFGLIDRVLRVPTSSGEVLDWLKALGMDIDVTNKDVWMITPPSWRYDIKISQDIIEEVARLYGYEKLPMAPLIVSNQGRYKHEWGNKKHVLSNLGYQEVISYSFIDEQLSQLFAKKESIVIVKNPISSEMNSMRPVLIAGLLTTAAYNLNRQQTRLKLYEKGQCFTQEAEGHKIDSRIAALICGTRIIEHWDAQATEFDFYDIKGTLEQIVDTNFQLLPSPCVFLAPGQAADVYIDGRSGAEKVGFVGAVHPVILRKLDIDKQVFVFEVKSSCIHTQFRKTMEPISLFPEVRRDIAFEVPLTTVVGGILDSIKKIPNTAIEKIVVFDVYHGANIGVGNKSVALGITFSSYKQTLQEKDINDNMERIVQHIKQTFQVVMRS